MPLLIKNGDIVMASDRYRADIYCAGETICRIEPAIDQSELPKNVEVIDAPGRWCFLDSSTRMCCFRPLGAQ